MAGLRQLQRLDLAYCKGVTDAGVKELAALQQLQSLNLQETEVTDAGLKELTALKQMQTLNLSFCSGVTDAGAEGTRRRSEQTAEAGSAIRCKGVTDAGLNRNCWLG